MFSWLISFGAAEVLSASSVELLKMFVKDERLDTKAVATTRLYVLRSVEGDEPTPLEERDVVELPVHVPLRDFVNNPVNKITPNSYGEVFLLVGPEDIRTRAFSSCLLFDSNVNLQARGMLPVYPRRHHWLWKSHKTILPLQR